MSAHGILRGSGYAQAWDGGGEDRRRARALHHATYSLALSRPEFSARIRATRRQGVAFLSLVGVLAGLFIFSPGLAANLLVAAMSFGFLVSLAVRSALACIGLRANCSRIGAAADAPLPVYTILVPLYHEAEVLPQLAGAIAAIDYPRPKIDLKIILEEDDDATRRAAEALGLEEIVVVPTSKPRTKPKACNYALQFARGEHLVIYDAEDRPEPDQLRKAVAAFRARPNVACFQARLSIDNGCCSWIAAMFALEYLVWFRTFLSGLACLEAPIPLGGTSNHFRTADLIAAGAWDPFNVTEDADLGFRLARLGRSVAMLDSTTFEAAPVRWIDWLRQRTRWMKGYMQTVLVHTRSPSRLLRAIGARNCFLMQAFLGGAIWSALVAPLLWGLLLIGLLGSDGTGALPVLAWTSGLSLLTANAVLSALSFAAERPRAGLAFGCAVLGYPIYLMLVSLAAYRALWQLLDDPFHWEKTPHGVTECVSS